MDGHAPLAVLWLSEPLLALGVGAALAAAGIPVAVVEDVAGRAEHGVVVGDPKRLSGREVDRLVEGDLGVLVLAHAIEAEHVRTLVRAGARGYLRADARPDELVDGVHAVAAGHLALTRAAQDAVFRGEARDVPALSPREQEILLLIADGLTTRQIAGRLYVGEATVKTHVQRLGQKLGESRRTGMLLRASRLGLV